MLHICVNAESVFTLPFSFTHFWTLPKHICSLFFFFVVFNFIIIFSQRNALRSFHVLENFVVFENELGIDASFLAFRYCASVFSFHFLSCFLSIHAYMHYLYPLFPFQQQSLCGRQGTPITGPHKDNHTSRENLKLSVNLTCCACFGLWSTW